MKSRFWLPALLGVALLLFVAGLSLPARLLPYLVDSQSLQLSAMRGTLRTGSASRVRVRTPAGYFHLGELDWSLAPLSLLGLAPAVQVRSVWGDQRASMELRLSGDTLRLRDVDVNLNAALLKQFLPVALKGRLGVLLNELRLTPDSLQHADGRLVWQGAAWQSPGGLRVLGNYAATLTSPGPEQLLAAVTTLSGPVTAEGTVALNQQRYAVDLLIESSGRDFDPELAQALSLIASPEENGYRLRLDGELAPSG